MASATEYDVISYYAYSMPSLSQENLLMNLLELDHLDFDKPWWHKSFTENATVYGKLYMATGDINLTSVTYRTALFFNKRLAEEYLPDTDLYQTVLDGKWTIDCMASLVKDIYNPVYIIGLRLPLGLRCLRQLIRLLRLRCEFLSVRLRFRYPFVSPAPHDAYLGSHFRVGR